MRTTKITVSSWLSSEALRSLLLVSSLVALNISGIPAAASSATLSATKTAAENIHRLDLSYLHRCEASDLARAIRGTLEEQKQLVDPEVTVTEHSDGNGNGNNDSDALTGESAVVDIDLTASLIGKNISEILCSLKREEGESSTVPEEERAATAAAAPSTEVRLTARRNQWSSREARALLEFVSDNGPTNETIAVSEELREEEKEEAPPLETETIDGNVTGAVSVSNDTDISPSPGDSNSETSSGMAGSGNEKEIEEAASSEIGNETTTATATAATTTTTTITTTRPAFVSIQSLDLGWNNLGSDNSNSGSRRRGSGVRAMNKALRKLVSDPKQCPPTIRLDVCGLGPSACRDLAKGIVERYQDPSGDEKTGVDADKIALAPRPLSLDLARNDGIGDVGVAALAAAIRTVASKHNGNADVRSKGKKKRRRRKKRSKQQQPKQGEEDENEAEEQDQEDVDDVENETETVDDTAEAESLTKEDSNSLEQSTAATTITIFERLDLSGCGIGDVGAQALAIALKNHPLCIKHLDLSNNHISDEGAAALARVLGVDDNNNNNNDENPAGLVQTLDLSYNKEVGDRGAKELARAFRGDGISNLILRSCNVRADGAACFGSAIRAIASQIGRAVERRRLIDLSGNPLGVLSKKKKSGSKYSATALRSKATDTTKAYMNIIGKSFQKGLSTINSLNNAESGGLETLESDDEEEERMGINSDDEDDSRKKCGALSLALAFLEEDNKLDATEISEGGTTTHLELALRHCSFDTKAAEALAAILQESRQKYPRIKLTMDMKMNDVLEEDIVAALHGEEGYDDQLADMAEVYLDALEVMREARERALKAAQMAAARAKAQAERESAWDAPMPGSRYSDDHGDVWSEDTEDDRWDPSIGDDYDRNLEDDYSDDDW
eukprot:CAMPEP_0172389894 /NCGR_PEP_ID=MMETSP1061-20121228/6678_1 /TAXON_ID=37318 /ORGANISM="Pseudo-nitzschia pungens, Strain cf. pungens" /LENGTH=901 /DNA_ID=CAMNT_0013120141 /DNA_START=125 /DNA_END=2830 /DNA_ORIENTATION=-